MFVTLVIIGSTGDLGKRPHPGADHTYANSRSAGMPQSRL